MASLIVMEPGIKFLKTAYHWDTKFTHDLNHIQSLKYLTTSKAIQYDNIIITGEKGYARLREAIPNIDLWNGVRPTYNKLIGKSVVTEVMGRKIRVVAVPPFNRMDDKVYRILYIRYMKKILPSWNRWYLKPISLKYKYAPSCKNLIQMILAVNPVFIAVDYETLQEVEATDRQGNTSNYTGVIDLVSLGVVHQKNGEWIIDTYVFPQKSLKDWENLRDVNALPVPKSMHNGFYDSEYASRWRAPMSHYLWDTQDFFKSICSDFTGRYSLHDVHSVWCRDSVYWKDLAEVKGQSQKRNWDAYCEYSAWDAHNTAEITLCQLRMFNPTNLNNYAYRKQFDALAHYCQMQSIAIDKDENARLLIQETKKYEDNLKFFKAITGLRPSQTKKLTPHIISMAKTAKALGVPEVQIPKGTGQKAVDSLIVAHPMYAYILNAMKDSRSSGTRVSTNLEYTKFYRWNDSQQPYLRYSMCAYTALSMRYASRDSAMWCGANVQNVPVYMRTQYVPREGFVFVSVDAPQSESYTTGYLADCVEMIRVLTDPTKDFHKYNASAIFRVRYEMVSKALRTLAKPAGHGYNYGLLAYGLLINIGVESARQLRQALGKSSKTCSLIGACHSTFVSLTKRYPEIRGRWYPKQVMQVIKSSRLFCLTGFSPIITKDPLKNPSAVRSIVSLESQNLSAHLNITGGNKILYNLLKGKYRSKTLLNSKGKPLDDVLIVLQLHDEMVMEVNMNWTIAQVDELAKECFSNSTRMRSGKTMVIPVGIPVIGDTWDELKLDEIDRDKISPETPIWKLTPKQWKKHE